MCVQRKCRHFQTSHFVHNENCICIEGKLFALASVCDAFNSFALVTTHTQCNPLYHSFEQKFVHFDAIFQCVRTESSNCTCFPSQLFHRNFSFLIRNSNKSDRKDSGEVRINRNNTVFYA